MNSKNIKEITNFILVIVYTYVHVFYLAPIINKITNGHFVSIGLWGLVVGVWGNFVGMRLVKPIYISDDYKKENYAIIILGTVFTVIGIILYFL